VYGTLARLQIARGELSHAVPLLERGLALSREWNLTYFSVAHTGSLGYAYALSGRIAESIPLLEQALSTVETPFLGHAVPLLGRSSANEKVVFAPIMSGVGPRVEEPGIGLVAGHADDLDNRPVRTQILLTH
jgi:hypothetical protein